MNSKLSKTLLLTVASVLQTDSYVKAASAWGPCSDTPTTVGNFKLDEYQVGNWYEVLRDGATWWQGGESCAVVRYYDWDGQYTDGAIEKETFNKESGEYSITDNLVRFDVNGKGIVRFDWLLLETAYQVLETDYNQYSVVYGCDTWLFGIFHTEQVWILSRDTVATDAVVEKAKQVLANKVPSYDQAGGFLLVEQGDDCTYKKPQVDEADLEMNKIFEENDSLEETQGEEEEQFNNSPNVGATKETNANFLLARAHMKQILKSVSQSMDFDEFSNSQEQSGIAVKAYLEDKSLGGGPIIVPKFFQDGSNKIRTPMRNIWKRLYRTITQAYKKGDKTSGGFFHLKNIQLDNPKQEGNQFVDIFLATDSSASYAGLISYNGTDEVKCCFNDNMDGVGLKQYISGLARIIQYTRDDSNLKKLAIQKVWDGEVSKGIPYGFGRLVDGTTSQSFIGSLYDNIATYKGLYYYNLEPKYQGIYNKIFYGDEPEAFKFKHFGQEKIDRRLPLTAAEKDVLIAEAQKQGISKQDATNPTINKAAVKTISDEKDYFMGQFGETELIIDDSTKTSANDLKRAEAQKESLKFVSLFLGTIDLAKHKQTSYTVTADLYLNDNLMGGGSLLKPKYAGDPDYPIDTPLKQDISGLMNTLVDENMAGKMRGGCFIFNNVTDNIEDQENDAKKAVIYRDVIVLTAGLDDETLARFTVLNNTDNAVWKDGTAKDGTQVKGISSKITGAARVVKYFQVKGEKTANSVIEVIDGKFTDGECDGLCRTINTKDNTSFIGYQEKDICVGKGMYIKDQKLVHVGTYDKKDNSKKTDLPKLQAKFTTFDTDSTEVIVNRDNDEYASLNQWGMAQAFIQAMKKEPTTIWGSTIKAKALYLTKANGGGSITDKFLVANRKKYQNPLAADWYRMVKQNKRDAYDGNPTKGGYIQILNLRKSSTELETFYNIDLYYCCNSEISNNLIIYNATDLEASEIFMDGPAGLYQYLNGMGRISEANAFGLQYLYEGRFEWGQPFGFGRLISEQEYTATGYFKDLSSMFGKGVYYPSNTAETVAKMGYYPETGANFLSTEPTSYEFNDFLAEKAKVVVIIEEGSVNLGGKCISSNQCVEGQGCLEVLDKKEKKRQICVYIDAYGCTIGKAVSFEVGFTKYVANAGNCLERTVVVVKEEAEAVVDSGKGEGEKCDSSDECKQKFGCLSTFDLNAQDKTQAEQYFCVKNNKSGCFTGCGNLLIVNNLNLRSQMDKCLPRTGSVQSKAELVKAELEAEKQQQAVSNDKTVPTDPNAKTPDEQQTPTKATDDAEIAQPEKGKDNRIVPRGSKSYETCKTSEECNSSNRCLKVQKKGSNDEVLFCVPTQVCSQDKGSELIIQDDTYTTLGVCQAYAKQVYTLPEKIIQFPLDGKSALYEECSTASRCNSDHYGCGAVKSVFGSIDKSVCLEKKKECLLEMETEIDIQNSKYLKASPKCMISDNVAGTVKNGQECGASEDCLEGNGCLKVLNHRTPGIDKFHTTHVCVTKSNCKEGSAKFFQDGIQYSPSFNSCLIPKPSNTLPSTLTEGRQCSESTDCITGLSCRSGHVSSDGNLANACVSDYQCTLPTGERVGLYNENSKINYEMTFNTDSCMKKNVLKYSVDDGGHCQQSTDCMLNKGCLPVKDITTFEGKKGFQICIEDKTCTTGTKSDFVLGQKIYRPLDDKCRASPQTRIINGFAENVECTKTEVCQQGLSCRKMTLKEAEKSVCVSQAICKLSKEGEIAKVSDTEYNILADSECIPLTKPVVPSLQYSESKDGGSLGTECQVATDCKSTADNHGCLFVSEKNKKTSVCVDNCSIGAGATVTIGTRELIVRTTTCMVAIPPEDTKENYKTVEEEGACQNSEQCVDAFTCMKVRDDKSQYLKICVRESDCRGNFGLWKLVGTKKYFYLKDVCQNRASNTDEVAVEDSFNKKPAKEVIAVVDVNSLLPVAKVVLKKVGESCRSTNQCQNSLGCLWVVDQEGDQDMLCVSENKYGCYVGVNTILQIRGQTFTSKMEHCLPQICSYL